MNTHWNIHTYKENFCNTMSIKTEAVFTKTVMNNEWNVNNNSFQFNNINYIQTLGKAMGTKLAPTYATLTLAYLEENLYEIIGKKYGNIIKEEFTKSWKRYLNDCFIFWKCPWGDINELRNLVQSLHPKIKFTMEHSSKELLFLDILIKKRKWPNHHRYLPQTKRHTIPPLQKPPTPKLYTIKRFFFS